MVRHNTSTLLMESLQLSNNNKLKYIGGLNMNVMKRIKSRFTMKFDMFNFNDTIGGLRVNDYKDCYGIKWMATSASPFAWRVMKSNQNQ